VQSVSENTLRGGELQTAVGYATEHLLTQLCRDLKPLLV
jgi:hypothetical protein